MKLAPGQFFGHTLRRREGAGLTLYLSQYRAGEEQPWHVHTHPTLFIPLCGDHRDHTRRQSHDQQELSAVFHPTAEPHASTVGPRGLLGLNLECGPAWLETHELSEHDLGGYRLLEPTVWARLAALRLLGIAWRPGPDAEFHTHGLDLLEPLIRQPDPPASTAVPAWLRRAEEYLHAGFRTAVSLREVAREAGVHPVYFARVFRRLHGCPISAYLRALRLVEAGRLVLRPGQTLAAAAVVAGFADQAHMTRCFARHLGFSPGSLRAAGVSFRA
jgi:AraC family transcriptional regulator